MLVWNDRHLDRVLTAYVAHYNTARPHRGVGLDVPVPTPSGHSGRDDQTRKVGRIQRVDVLGGLIHEYRHAA
jgi:hypothetical protein